MIWPAILKRAGNRCQDCGAANGHEILRSGQFWRSAVQPFECLFDKWMVTVWRLRPSPVCIERRKVDGRTLHLVRIVLTIAHLNHVSGDDRPENLKALCQWCHLNFDKYHHAETRSIRKDGTRPLLSNALSPDGLQIPTEAKTEESTNPTP